MHILFYGYGSHAKRLKKSCEDYFKGYKNIIFSGIKRKKVIADIDIFSNLEEVVITNGVIDCVFITANNQFHLEIFKKCISHKINYIYVEKPAIGVEDFFKNSLGNQFEEVKYIQVGYHMIYLDPFIKLKKIISNKELGQLIRIDIFSGHGLAYKKGFENSWRAIEKNALIDTVLSHFINLIIHLDALENFNEFIHISRKNERNKIIDTEHLSFTNNNGTIYNVSVSWGSPLEKVVKAYFSDGIWEYDFNKISLKYPRDNFDENGLFISPSKSKENSDYKGIDPSVFYFLDQVKSKISKTNEFNNSSLTSLLIKEIILKRSKK